jgi:hypothetical protein
MSNGRGKGTSVTLEQWINTPGIRKGILAVYANEPFDYDDNRVAYEIGRQIALLAKEAGLTTRGSILRRKPKSQQMAIVKTKMTILSEIIYRRLKFKPDHLRVEMF